MTRRTRKRTKFLRAGGRFGYQKGSCVQIYVLIFGNKKNEERQECFRRT